MILQEKKYSVDSFEPILELISKKSLSVLKKVTSVHYYGKHEGLDVEKFVEYPDRVEVHVLKEHNGKFTPTEDFPLKDREEGFAWLKKRGYKVANIVKMDYVEYKYKNGTLGLYRIDDFLLSIILNYPPGKHEVIEKEFGLENTDQIIIPYNKMLEKMGKLQSINLI